MKETALHFFICTLAVVLSLVATNPLAFAQPQALNGQIEGTVSDENNAFVANAFVTAANIETGATRTVKSDQSGIYRFPLLPLGTYRIAVEAADFKKFVREGIVLSAGQTATIDIRLQIGEISEVVTVSADTSIADAGKTDLSRVINNRDVQNLPIPQRNPYNLGRLQTNVTGRPLRGFNNANLNVNGYFQRTNYLFDGNWGNLADRPGVRLLFVSETYVQEVQIVTNGFSAEFGNTPGMIMNVITPSGANNLRGSVGFRFSRTPFYARPFFYPSPDDLPVSDFNNLTATLGGAFIRDRWHFYGGFESYRKDENTLSEGVITIRPDHKAQLIAAGLRPEIFPVSNPLKTSRDFYIFRTDAQLNKNNRLTGRFNRSPNLFYSNGISRLSTLERSVNSKNRDYSIGVQLVSYTPTVLNELRFQYVRRILKFERNELSGTAPAVTITGVANLGSTLDADVISPLEKPAQLQNNLTLTRGAHVFKFGGGFNYINSFKRLALTSNYIFSSNDEYPNVINAYIAARNGTNPRSYTRYEETFGNPEIGYRATYWNFFAQDDWKLSRRLKINFGLRYDLYLIPKADPSAPLAFSQKFNVDKNNLAPRLGIAYALREGERPTVIRFGAGIYYETPWLDSYERALRNNGNPRFFTVRFTPPATNQPDCAPVFPNIFSGNLPSCAVFQRDIDAIAPDFVNLYAFHTNFQIEQAITENLSIAAGYVHSEGRHLPVTRQINCVPTGATLADGRPIFGETSSCQTRIFSQFRNIQMVESVGNLRYDALGLQLTRRFSGGLQFSASYTFSKATDDAPDFRLENLILSDASNRRFDRGLSTGDQRHTFVMSAVLRPEFNFENKTLRRIFNHNQFSIIANANSGERFNIVSSVDLNRDGFLFDRPAGIPRNAGKTPPQYNVDLRYSRFFNFSERYKLEVFSEFQNLFNINRIVEYNDLTVSNVNPQTGELIGELPNFKSRNNSTAQESRQVQLGLKFIF
jgi:hypothetical protein